MFLLDCASKGGATEHPARKSEREINMFTPVQSKPITESQHITLRKL